MEQCIHFEPTRKIASVLWATALRIPNTVSFAFSELILDLVPGTNCWLAGTSRWMIIHSDLSHFLPPRRLQPR